MKIIPFPSQILNDLNPSQINLLEMLCDRMNEEMIDDISMADYGQNSQTVFVELSRNIQAKTNPVEMTTYLHENLQLYRWMDGDLTQDEYLARALCCFYLLNLNHNTTYDYDGDDVTLGILIDSVLHLGKDFHEPMLHFIAWKILENYKEDLSYYEEGDEDIEELDIIDHFNVGLVLLMLLNRVDEKAIDEVFSHLAYENIHDDYFNRVVAFREFIQDSRSFVKPKIWTNVIKSILSVIDFLEDEVLLQDFKQIKSELR